MLRVVAFSLISALFVSVEILSTKWLEKRKGVSGDLSGMFFLFIEGLIGTLCLFVTTQDGGGLHEMSLVSFLMMVMAGVFAYLAIMMLSYAITVGVAGVSLSIFNTNASM